jgi:serine/threonine protein kinase
MSTSKLSPGTILGRYELLLPIAQGGMATVWAARQKGSRGFSKTVAVKTMLPNLSEDAQFEQMFLDEASIASRIHHPNVAEILDLGEQDDVLYLVMEWVDGESLSAIAKQTKKTESEIPLRIILKMLAQASAGLHAAHELRDDNDELVELVHRDVSPQNILVASSGVVKLVDFGVAKALGRSGATSVGQLKGKVPYMSPEQTRGHSLDRRTDIFAMGSVLYRMVTGIHPFIDDNDIKTMRNIATRPAIRPRVKNPKLPAELEQVILKALEKSASKRYQTAAELETDLEKVLAATGGPVSNDEIGLFVRATLAERDQKRRAALRDAVRAADETALSASSTSLPLIVNRNSIETISDLMLTKTSTPPSFVSGLVADRSSSSSLVPKPPVSQSDRPSAAGAPRTPSSPAPSSALADAADPATRVMESLAEDEATRALVAPDLLGGGLSPTPPVPRLSEPPLASSPTLAAVMGGETGSQVVPRRRTGVALGIGLGVALAAVSVVLIVHSSGSSKAAAEQSQAAAAKGDAAEHRSTSSPETTSAAITAPQGTPTAAATTLSVDELPDSVASAAGTTRSPGVGAPHIPAVAPGVGAPHTVAAATPATAAPTSKPADKPATPPVTPTSKPWVPAVQDPGF